jgi:FAD/FMN-containing dehydrogenase
VRHKDIFPARWPTDPLAGKGDVSGGSLLPFGNGRSYGDSCLNDGGSLIDARPLDRFVSFDAQSGLLHCEAGVLLSEILALTVPRGWFLPVTPGTQFVTLGGAIANDVHGKNHHRAGSFGNHVESLELLRSDGSRRHCSPGQNEGLFGATIGGLGLTGLITRAGIRLKPVAGPFIDQALVPFASIHDFFALAAGTDEQFEHTVAWVDCSAAGSSLGRGILMCGNHASRPSTGESGSRHLLSIPVTPPVSLIGSWSLKLFNGLYFRLQRRKQGRSQVHYRPFFYPLDNILSWNRIYGPRGFFQYQCAVPFGRGEAAIREMLERIGRSGAGSFLAVLKRFGGIQSPGILSFPRQGYTLALDFPNHGDRTLSLLESLDDVTREAGGAVYPAKDARMSPESFQTYYPQWRVFAGHKDPAFSSSFWRRVTGEGG